MIGFGMQATVIYDGDCGICTRSMRIVTALDHLRLLRWIPLQGQEAQALGIPREEMERALQLVAGRHRTAGFSAFKRIFLRLPLFWILAGLAVWLTLWSLLAIALLFSPLSNPVGNRVYEWIARNRYRFPGSTCQRPF